MKQILSTLLLLTLVTVSYAQNDAIVIANCLEFDKENNCMATSGETTPINVYVNLTTLPDIAETDWFVEISRNVAYELPVIVNRDVFEGPDCSIRSTIPRLSKSNCKLFCHRIQWIRKGRYRF